MVLLASFILEAPCMAAPAPTTPAVAAAPPRSQGTAAATRNGNGIEFTPLNSDTLLLPQY